MLATIALRFAVFGGMCLWGAGCSPGTSPDITNPDRPSPDTVPALPPALTRVSVLPLFVVPAGGRDPTTEEQALLAAHLRLAQGRYAELLTRRDSFALGPAPVVHRSTRALAYFRGGVEGGAPALVEDVLGARHVNRYTAEHVFVLVVMNDADDFPVGGGRPLNGGLGTGAGVVVLSSFALNQVPNFQSTLQHELGHAFGLVHVEAYGEDMATSRSLMSYNPAHHTVGLTASTTPGELLPVELAALALNRRVFPALAATGAVAIPPPAPGVPDLAWLPPMTIPGQDPVTVTVTTPSGEEYGSAASRVVQGRLRPSAGPGVTFDASSMWHSSTAADGWVVLDLVFPATVTLTGLGLHTGHSGLYHQAVELRLERAQGTAWTEVRRSAVTAADCLVGLSPSAGRSWRLKLRAGSSAMVVVRGLEFRGVSGEDVFPPMVREVPPAGSACGG